MDSGKLYGIAGSCDRCGVWKGEYVKRRLRFKKKKSRLDIKTLAVRLKTAGPFRSYYEGKLRKEMGEGLSIMRNIIVSGEGSTVGADLLLLRLSRNKGMLKNTYCRMLSLMRLGKTEEAAELMKAFGSEKGEEYGRIIMLWDETGPGALLQIILSFQRSLREESITAGRKRDEIISDLIYIPAVFNVMLIFINFIYTGYFLEQQEMLRGMLG